MINNQDPDADLVEVVARAICRADPEVHMGDAYGVVEQRVYTEWHRYGWQARAALSALGLPARLQAAKDAGREESAGIVENCGDMCIGCFDAIRERIGKP